MDKHYIVLVTYNRLNLLGQCLTCIKEQTVPYDGIVVIDNASTDGTEKYLSGQEDLLVERQMVNRGGAGGFRRGIQLAIKAGADWITVIDDDAMLYPDFLEQIRRAISENQNGYLAYAGVPLTEGLRLGHRRRVVGRFIKKEQPVPKEEYEKESFCCDLASFCGLVISREGVSKIGYPRQDYFIWFDDAEYTLRLSPYGGIQNINTALIDHKAIVDKGGTIGWKDYYGVRNSLDMARHHYGFLTFFYLFMRKTLKGAFYFCKSDEKSGRIYIRGVMDGMAGKMGKNKKYLPD